MSKKRKPNTNPRLSTEALRMVEYGSSMMSEVLSRGGIPEMIIGAKPINAQTGALDYFVVSMMSKEQIKYVLSRVLGLLDGSIRKNN